MKKLIKYLSLGFLLVGMVACEKEAEIYNSIDTKDAYNSVLDVENGVNGAYYALGTSNFVGKNVIALGDMAADVSAASTSTGHFVAINQYAISEYTAELTQIWSAGYKIVDRCVRTINGADTLINRIEAKPMADWVQDDVDDLQSLYASKFQCYALRALSEFYLVNIFGLPYNPAQVNNQLGIVLVRNNPVEPFSQVERATVEEVYAAILQDITDAKAAYAEFDNYNSMATSEKTFNQFYMNLAAINALEARVNLYMGKYTEAITAANQAITLRDANPVSDESYVKMWSSIAISDEDIFTVAKSENDNLSANALNTLYGSYKATITLAARNKLAATDIRKSLIGTYTVANQPAKWQGIPTSQATSNIPVFRVSEMYLIIAEAQAQLDALDLSKTALLFTAKRNSAITTEADITAADKAALLAFIADERVREFFAEGHRWYDLRRTGASFTFNGAPFAVANFVFPIPFDEVATGSGVEQNENWDAALPN